MPRRKRKLICSRKRRKFAAELPGPLVVQSAPLNTNKTPKTTQKRSRQPTAVPISSRKRHKKSSTCFSKKVSVTKDMVDLFIELDELDDKLLKKAVSMIRHKLQVSKEGVVEVINVDTDTEVIEADCSTEQIEEEKQEIEEPIVEQPILEQPVVEEPSPVKPRQTIPSLIQLNQKSLFEVSHEGMTCCGYISPLAVL